jgi:hypothetical protein
MKQAFGFFIILLVFMLLRQLERILAIEKSFKAIEGSLTHKKITKKHSLRSACFVIF